MKAPDGGNMSFSDNQQLLTKDGLCSVRISLEFANITEETYLEFHSEFVKFKTKFIEMCRDPGGATSIPQENIGEILAIKDGKIVVKLGGTPSQQVEKTFDPSEVRVIVGEGRR